MARASLAVESFWAGAGAGPAVAAPASLAAPAAGKVSAASRRGRELRGKAFLAEPRPALTGAVAGVVRAESGVSAGQMAALVEPV